MARVSLTQRTKIASISASRRLLRHVDDAAPSRRGSAVLGPDQGAQKVDAVVEVIVLGIDVDAYQIRVVLGVGVGQGTIALAGDVGERMQIVALPFR